MMRTDWYFPTAFSHWGDEEHSAMAHVISSGRYTMGPETEALEEELAAFNRRKHCVAVNSGSSANLIAVAAFRQTIGEFAHASVPALAWGTTYAPLVQTGIDFSLVDCDESWCADISAAEKKDIAVTCSILGNPAQLDRMADEWSFWLNDDCEAFGATVDGRPTASFGTVATQSFFYSHQLSAVEGGAALTDDDDLAETMRMLRDHGTTRSVKKVARFEDEYDFRLFGYNVRPVEMHMAIAREQLRKAFMFKAARRRNWNAFVKATTDLPIVFPIMGEGYNPFGLHFTCETREARAKLVQALRANGIDCRLPTGGSFRLHKYGEPWRDQQTPNADRIHRTGLFLGNAPYDIEEKIAKAAAVMREVFSGD